MFKAPTGEFKNEQGLIPTGEGQWDFDFIFQVGRSFWPFRAYLNANLGYRMRLKMPPSTGTPETNSSGSANSDTRVPTGFRLRVLRRASGCRSTVRTFLRA